MFDISLHPVQSEQGRVVLIVPEGRDITYLKRAEAALRDSEGRLATEREQLAVAQAVSAERQALLKRFVHAQEEERARLSRDIHDSVTQLAHAAAMHLDNAAELLDGTPAPARAEVERGRDLARAAATEARRLITGLRPETLDTLGLTGAIGQEIEALRMAGWKIEFSDADLNGVRLDPEAEITLFRVTQEALNNVRKHAGPAPVRVSLRRVDGSVRVEVRDWGRGFNPKTVRTSRRGERVGLVGMRERMALLGGSLQVRSGSELGTTVRATLPLAAAND